MISDSNDPFIKATEKAILFVTCASEPELLRVYFGPKDFDAARAAAPLDKEPEEVEVYDEFHKRNDRYPLNHYMMQGDEFPELELLVKRAKEGKIAQIHSPGTLAEVLPQVEHFLKLRQVISNVNGSEYTLALEHPDNAVSPEELPKLSVQMDDAEAKKLALKSQKFKN